MTHTTIPTSARHAQPITEEMSNRRKQSLTARWLIVDNKLVCKWLIDQ
jgi:hypothetical protein